MIIFYYLREEAGRYNDYGNFLDRFRFARNNETRQYLIAEPPIDAERYPIDVAILVATIEVLVKEYELQMPDWVMAQQYVLTEPYFADVRIPEYRDF